MEEKFQKIYKYIMLITITAFITFVITTVAVSNYYMSGKSDKVFVIGSQAKNKTETSIDSIQAIIDKYYLGEQNEKQMTEGAIKGYVAGLGDPYSEYITSSEMEEYTTQLLGNYVGIGIYMIENTEYNMVQVLSPIIGSPAHEAGILPGDLIKSIDGVDYTAENMTAAANNIKGKEGTNVKLTIIRNNEELDFELTRRTVITNPINSEVLENNIGYMEVTSFDKDTGEEFKGKFEELNKQGIKSLIIDLRNNGGGLVSEALEIADYITEKGDTLLITVNKNGKEERQRHNQSQL